MRKVELRRFAKLNQKMPSFTLGRDDFQNDTIYEGHSNKSIGQKRQLKKEINNFFRLRCNIIDQF